MKLSLKKNCKFGFLRKITSVSEKAPYIDDLLAAVSKGDENAFAVFFDRHQSRVYSIAYYFTQSSAIAEDIVQDVFLKIWKSKEQLIEIKHPERWIARIARNQAINGLKKMARERLKNEEYANNIPPQHTSSGHLLFFEDLKEYLDEAMSSLTQQQRRAYELNKLEGMNRDEIATIMNISPNTVKMHLVRASKYVRAFMVNRIDYILSILLFHLF